MSMSHQLTRVAKSQRAAFRTRRASNTIGCSLRKGELAPLKSASGALDSSWRVVLPSCALSLMLAGPAFSLGIETPDLPFDIDVETAENYAARTEASRSTLDAAEEKFRNSQTLKDLLARSEQNRSKNKRQILNKYCYRQAEWGVGDCGGLNLIPGATENGKQKTPEWLLKLLGVQQEEETTITSKELLDQAQ